MEAALVTPLIVTMLFGILEMAFLMKDNVALTSAVRLGGRTASASAGAGPGSTDDKGDCIVPCTSNSVPKLAVLAANAIQRGGSALPEDSISEMWVYKANAKGYPGATGASTWTCGADCVKFSWVKAKNQFRYVSGSWTSSTINACPGTSDGVGIYMKANHAFLTGLLGSSLSIEDHAVFAFEPLDPGACATGQHL
jgi:hypothetical protein